MIEQIIHAYSYILWMFRFTYTLNRPHILLRMCILPSFFPTLNLNKTLLHFAQKFLSSISSFYAWKYSPPIFQIIITSALIGIPFPIICCIGLALGRLPRETSGKSPLSSLNYEAFSPDVSCAIHDCLLFSGQAWQPQLFHKHTLRRALYPPIHTCTTPHQTASVKSSCLIFTDPANFELYFKVFRLRCRALRWVLHVEAVVCMFALVICTLASHFGDNLLVIIRLSLLSERPIERLSVTKGIAGRVDA